MWRWAGITGGLALATWAFVRGPKRTDKPPEGFWYKATEIFGGRAFDPKTFSRNLDGLSRYLRAARVDSPFSAQDIATPNHADIALDLGYRNLLPMREDWKKVAALMALARRLVDAAQEPVELRNLWRPTDYNARVGGASGSAHIEAAAMDLDFDTEEGKERAEAVVRAVQASEPWLKVGLGVGRKTLHVDMLTDKAQRPNTWRY